MPVGVIHLIVATLSCLLIASCGNERAVEASLQKMGISRDRLKDARYELYYFDHEGRLHLRLDGEAIHDLAPVSGFRLRELVLSRTSVDNLSELAGARELSRLDIADTLVADLTPLTNCVALDYLDVSRSPVTDLSPLAGLAIRQLGMNGCQIGSFAPLNQLPSLSYLWMRGVQIPQGFMLTNAILDCYAGPYVPGIRTNGLTDCNGDWAPP